MNKIDHPTVYNDDFIVSVKEEYENSQIEKILGNLQSDLIGLKPVKTRIREIAALLLVDRLRKKGWVIFRKSGITYVIYG